MMNKEELLKVTIEQAYEWVKTGHWDLKTFKFWHNVLVDQVEADAVYYANL